MTSAVTFRELSRTFITASQGAKALGFYQARRERHLEAATFPWIFHGLEREPGAEHNWIMPAVRVFQEPSVQYLTGLNQAHVTVILDPTVRKKDQRAVLFLPWKDPAREFWDGVRLGLLPPEDPLAKVNLTQLQELLGFSRILPADQLPEFVHALGQKHSQIGVFHHSYPGGKRLTEDHNAHFAQLVQRLVKPAGCKVVSIASEHYELRLPLDRWQIQECDTAQKWTEEAFREVLPLIPKMKSETELVGRLEGAMLARSTWGLAFPTICAVGKNAATLHYLKNDDPFKSGEMVLLDFGCRAATMHADLSRTIPVNGRYNPLQRLLTEIVIEAMERNEKRVKPGVTIRELNRATWDDMEQLLQERFVARGGKMHRPYVEGRLETLPAKAKAHPCQPHGVSHLMGEQEHDGDPFRLYQDQPLRENMQLSNEPGLYGKFSIRLEGKLWTSHLGIRVEDDLLVTRTGCRNLSRHIPKNPDEIEALMTRTAP